MEKLSRSLLIILAQTGLALAMIGWAVGLLGGFTNRLGLNGGVLEQKLTPSGVTICQHDGSKFGSLEPTWEYSAPHWANVAFFAVFCVLLRLAYRDSSVENSQ